MTEMIDTAQTHIVELGTKARAASQKIATASTEDKNAALMAAAQRLRDRQDEILAANKKDVKSVEGKKNDAFIDRLRLTPDRIEGMATALEDIAKLPDPVDRVLATFERPNGLTIERISCPIGVIGMIYESRPNVGADASALCLKSGNAVILRGGSESKNSTREIVDCMQHGLKTAGLPVETVQTVGTTDRRAVAELLKAVEFVDLVIPRGGRGLVVVTNAKLRRTGVCGATESIVIDRSIAETVIPKLIDSMTGCELRGDKESLAIDSRLTPANDDDWSQEYLETIASVKIVGGVDEAIDFVSTHSSHHTDAILTENEAVAKRFMKTIDSAVVMHNASTQFSDGGEFGMGAEIGIATGKMHARGPVGLEQLTSFKYLVHGNGQTRP